LESPEHDRGEDGKSGEEDGADAGDGGQLGREGLTGRVKRLGAERGGHNTLALPLISPELPGQG
jgi:hypothetical protein